MAYGCAVDHCLSALVTNGWQLRQRGEGSALDDDCVSGPVPPAELAEDIQALLYKADVVVTHTQETLWVPGARVAPVVDLRGFRGNHPSRSVIVEVKCGEAIWKSTQSALKWRSRKTQRSAVVYMQPPWGSIPDTPYYRAMCQLACQVGMLQLCEHEIDTCQDALLLVANPRCVGLLMVLPLDPLVRTVLLESSPLQLMSCKKQRCS